MARLGAMAGTESMPAGPDIAREGGAISAVIEFGDPAVQRRREPVKRALRGVVLVAACLLLSTSAFAQVSTAQLSGRVTDQHGNVLQVAAVTAIQIDTKYTRDDLTDANGLYLLSNLPPGPYKLQVSLQ